MYVHPRRTEYSRCHPISFGVRPPIYTRTSFSLMFTIWHWNVCFPRRIWHRIGVVRREGMLACPCLTCRRTELQQVSSCIFGPKSNVVGFCCIFHASHGLYICCTNCVAKMAYFCCPCIVPDFMHSSSPGFFVPWLSPFSRSRGPQTAYTGLFAVPTVV